MIWVDAHLSPALAQWSSTLPRALELIAKGDALVEISGRP
jgi:hypothetical protein